MIDTLSIIGEPKLIGGGGNSKVYECQSDKFPVNHKIILKIGGNIEGNIRNFELIKSLGLPSLDFLERWRFNGQVILVTNHLNLENVSSIIFVTPNSVITDIERQLTAMKLSTKKDRIESIAENFRYDNKLSAILNFDDFISNTLEDIENVSNNNIVIEYDSYFIGSKKMQLESEINYRIADLDNIFNCQDKTKEECLEINKIEFFSMLKEFITHFVSEGNNKEKYQIKINKISKQ